MDWGADNAPRSTWAPTIAAVGVRRVVRSSKSLIHATQSFGKNAHQLQCEFRHLLNQVFELGFIDCGNFATGLGHCGCHPGHRIHLGHFAKHAAGLQCFDELPAHAKVYLAFYHDVHIVAVVALLEYGLSGRKCQGVFIRLEYLDGNHAGLLCSAIS